jgi:uncharacterized membrane protein
MRRPKKSEKVFGIVFMIVGLLYFIILLISFFPTNIKLKEIKPDMSTTIGFAFLILVGYLLFTGQELPLIKI